ncbi:histone-lysine N-methyltransferase 2B-like [Triticum dicoccoides]|uniref:histone-lysine N-methyltransferase 2B-like n=1 Tax=Triticum dicoccoides TaxID=85692 RepID=UPI00188F9AC3|nr:histone-lysine N-methyltransferase 2B-like [Triticum dicoccoides]
MFPPSHFLFLPIPTPPQKRSPTQSTRSTTKRRPDAEAGSGRGPAPFHARRRRPPLMPSPPKDRPAGRLGRLISALRPARAGPLPVQTGFPTSLADLFVKNHGRLKKQQGPSSGRRKRRGAPPLPSPVPSPPPPSPPPPSPPPAAVSPPSAQPGPDPPRAEPVCRLGGQAAGLGLGFLALVGVASLALLVIWSRKVVAAVTVAAFSLFLLESVRASSLRRRPRPPAPTTELDIDGRGYVSPIRELEAEPEPLGSSFSDSGRGFSASTLGIDERSEAGEDSCVWEPKPRKRSPWRKLIPRKLQRGRKVAKDSGSLSSSFRSSSFRSEVSLADSTVGGNAIARATDPPDSRRGRRSQANAKGETAAARSRDSSGRLRLGIMGDGDGAGIKSADSSGPLRGMGGAEVRNNGASIEIEEPAGVAVADGVGVGRGGGGGFPLAAVTVVVLVGLVAGRLPAVALTVLVCAALQRLRRDGTVVPAWEGRGGG